MVQRTFTKEYHYKITISFFFALTELAGVLCLILIGMERKESVWCYNRI